MDLTSLPMCAASEDVSLSSIPGACGTKISTWETDAKDYIWPWFSKDAVSESPWPFITLKMQIPSDLTKERQIKQIASFIHLSAALSSFRRGRVRSTCLSTLMALLSDVHLGNAMFDATKTISLFVFVMLTTHEKHHQDQVSLQTAGGSFLSTIAEIPCCNYCTGVLYWRGGGGCIVVTLLRG